MSDSARNDPVETGLDKGTGDPNDDRTFLDDLPPALVEEDAGDDSGTDSETDGDA